MEAGLAVGRGLLGGLHRLSLLRLLRLHRTPIVRGGSSESEGDMADRGCGGYGMSTEFIIGDVAASVIDADGTG